MMNQDCSLYSKFNTVMVEHVKYIFKNFPVNFPQQTLVLDAGCATGEITRIILDAHPNIKQITAIDISEIFLEFAKKHNNHSKIEYQSANLQDLLSIKQEWFEMFDYCFSFLVFHWLPDQNVALNFIAQCLKPGGGALLTFITKPSHNIAHANNVLLNHSKWKQYFKDVKSNMVEKAVTDVCCTEDNFLVKYSAIIEQIKDLQLIQMQFRPFPYKFKEKNYFKGFLQAISSVVQYIPKSLQDEFMDDYMNEIYNITPQSDEGFWFWENQIVIIELKKRNKL